MTRRRAAPDDGPPLFAAPARPKGARERAVERQLAAWRAAGRDIGPAVSSSLRTCAFAVDLAVDKGDPWQVTNALRILLELSQGYGLVDRPEPVDEYAALLDRLEDADHAAGVRDAAPA